MTAAHLGDLAVGPMLAACALLVAAGATKVRAPAGAAAALVAAGMRAPVAEPLARGLGVVEIGVGIGGAAFGGPAAAVVGLVYLALGAFVVVLLRRAPGTACGCLGSSTPAPATRTRAALNASAAIVGVTAAFGDVPWRVVADQPLRGIPFLVLVACAARLAALVVDGLPSLRIQTEGGR